MAKNTTWKSGRAATEKEQKTALEATSAGLCGSWRAAGTRAGHRAVSPPSLQEARLSTAQVPAGLQVRRHRTQLSEAAGTQAQAPGHLLAALRRGLETGEHPHPTPTCRHLAWHPCPCPGQEAGRTTRLHLLPDSWNLGHCGVCHHHL